MVAISAVMSVYNGEEFLSEAIESVICQLDQIEEFIIVDNGSTDRTPEILSKYVSKNNKITIITNTCVSSYANGRDVGIKAAKTDWVALFDADDICHEDRFKVQKQYLNTLLNESAKVGAVSAWADYINASGVKVGRMVTGPTTNKEFYSLYQKNEPLILVDPCSIINRNVYLEVGGYRAWVDPPCDLDLWYRIAEAGYELRTQKKVLLSYRVHLKSNSVANTLKQRRHTHHVNYIMRLRRQGKEEISYIKFEELIWSRFGYKLPRYYNDLYLNYFKLAALNYIHKNYLKFITYVTCAFILKPHKFTRKAIHKIWS